MKPRQIARLLDGHDVQWIDSTCGLCSIGCGLQIAVADGEIRGVRGRVEHPVNLGRLGPKGLGQWRANRHPSRGRVPRIAGANATWDEALELVARKIDETIAHRGPAAIGFYNSGQLVLEEYYTLAKIARAGLGTPNIDANTRLCTATVGESLVASFGADGTPGAFEDFDEADCIVLFGHNAAEQSTVLWMRILAAKDAHGTKLVAIDPRRTLTAASCDLHLAPRPGTNLAVIDGIVRELIVREWIDRDYIRAHTTGFEELRAIVAPYTPEEVERIAGVPAAQLRLAAEWIGTSPRVVTTCLQGVYQANQATATASAVNSMHLVMGKLGKPGCAPFQFAGQPSSSNTRECGADGAYPGFRNWANPAHMLDLARRWNVSVALLGHKPVSAPEIFEMVAHRQIDVLFAIGTNPAASFVDRERVISGLHETFLVVMDPFADTETVALADVYLPTAMWGEKTGCMTNAERRCNLVQKAVEPPGEARADLDILIELSHRLALVDKSGDPLIGYRDARGAFDEWRRISKGTICDYSGMTYERLAHGGLQWPCNDDHPDGTTRLYAGGEFPTTPDRTEVYQKDLQTGHARTRREYAGQDGKARLIAARYEPPPEIGDAEFPFVAVTGRVAVHWHTRTKTGKVPELADAAPRSFVELSMADAARLGVEDGELVRVIARRGEVVAPAKVGDVVPDGVVFVPFHFGDANELTPALHDPVSKQPLHKHAAVRVERVGGAPDAWWRQP